MASRRDAVQQVLDIKRRNRQGHRSQIYFDRVGTLKRAFKGSGYADEVLRYFPIGIIATVESFFRAVYAELIDTGEPYASRVSPLIKDLRIDWHAIRAIEGKTVSTGETIAVSLPLSNLGDIQRVMGTLLGGDFLGHLRELKHDSAKQKDEPILGDSDETFKYVSRSFELRHIFCHEAASGIQTDRDEIESCLDYCALFLHATDTLLWRLHPHYGLTQRDLTDKAEQGYQKAQLELKVVLEKLNGILEKGAKETLEVSQKRWQDFSDANSAFMAFLYKGGTMHPMVLANSRTHDTASRTRQLEGFLTEWRSLTELL